MVILAIGVLFEIDLIYLFCLLFEILFGGEGEKKFCLFWNNGKNERRRRSKRKNEDLVPLFCRSVLRDVVNKFWNREKMFLGPVASAAQSLCRLRDVNLEGVTI